MEIRVRSVRTIWFHPVNPPGETRWDAHAYLFEQGFSLHTHRLHVGPDGMWRGGALEVIG
jgi:hypothetical protein